MRVFRFQGHAVYYHKTAQGGFQQNSFDVFQISFNCFAFANVTQRHSSKVVGVLEVQNCFGNFSTNSEESV